MKASACLTRLEKCRTLFGMSAAVQKLEWLTQLRHNRLTTAAQVRRLHEVLCFLRAWPDNPQILALSDQMLADFRRRPDLQRFRKLLVNSGIAGTDIEYRFYWPMACWLATNWPGQLSLLWPQIDRHQREQLMQILPLLLPEGESEVLDQFDLSVVSWIRRLKGPLQTDAVFYLDRLKVIYRTDPEREQLHDGLDLTYRLRAGKDTPVIGTGLLPRISICFQDRPLRSREDLADYLQNFRCQYHSLPVAEGRRMVDLARTTMVTHERDLDAFSYGNPADVLLVELDHGYRIVCVGLRPERRYLLHASYGLLTLKNGMPVAYCPLSTLFNSAEIAFNLFSAFRGGESALIYSMNLAVAHTLFGADNFSIEPNQLGHNNRDGLKSGVWWFYYKLGFRPRDRAIARLADRELDRMQRQPGYRSGLVVLNRLAAGSLHFTLNQDDEDSDLLSGLGTILSGISTCMSDRFGSAREQGQRMYAHRAAALTDMRRRRQLSADERDSWNRWAPLIMNLPEIKNWSVAERRALGRLACLKGAASQIGYLQALNSHKRLRQSLLKLADRTRP